MSNSLAVIGAGAWGTALAIQADRAGSRVTLWARNPEKFANSRRNPRLPGHEIPASIAVTNAFSAADMLLLVTPLQHLRDIARQLPKGGPLVVCAKGVESETLRLPLEILAEIWPGRAAAVLTGPNFAHEIAAGLPAATVVAGTDPALRAQVIAALTTPAFRLYGNDDPIGAQIGGAAKNVIAIAAGAVIGAKLGENARAALVTRGLAELARLAIALGGKAETVAGLSGVGDLLLTCSGAASRNYRLGMALGEGRKLPNILAMSGGVAEGVATAPALVARAVQLGVSVPICEAVAHVVTGRIDIREAVERLLSRPLRDE